MRRYRDPVEVRRGWVDAEQCAGEGPHQFLWRGRVWQVRAVLAHWVETGAWWSSARVLAAIGSGPEAPEEEQSEAPGWGDDLLTEREFWRVEAAGGRDSVTATSGGVFELTYDTGDGRWLLVGCAD